MLGRAPFVLVAILASSVAAAQTLTTDRLGADTSATLGFAVSSWDKDETSFEVTGLRYEAHVQYMRTLAFGRLGGFVTLPVSYAILGLPDTDGENRDLDNEWDMGNLDIGVAYARSLAPILTVIGRASIAIGTADDEDTEPVGSEGLGNAATTWARITDTVLGVPDSTWLRLSASALSTHPLFTSPATNLELRADVGIDIPLADDESTKTDPFARANLAATYHHGLAGVGFELATIMKTGDVADGVDRFLHTFAAVLTTRAIANLTPTIGVVVPMDKWIRDGLGHEYSFALAISGTLPSSP